MRSNTLHVLQQVVVNGLQVVSVPPSLPPLHCKLLPGHFAETKEWESITCESLCSADYIQ